MKLVFRLFLLSLVVLVVGAFGWPTVDRFVQDSRAAATQDDLRAELSARLPKPSPDTGSIHAEHHPRPTIPTATGAHHGHPIAVLRIPRFGRHWDWVLAEGVDEDVLAGGPGHYEDTVLPGAVGNVGIAAHRAGHGDPFIDFDQLRPGDKVRITQGSTTWIYRLYTRPRIVPVTATWVLRPTGGRQLTLTTCWPKYGSSKRMFVRGRLARVVEDRNGSEHVLPHRAQ